MCLGVLQEEAIRNLQCKRRVVGSGFLASKRLTLELGTVQEKLLEPQQGIGIPKGPKTQIIGL